MSLLDFFNPPTVFYFIPFTPLLTRGTLFFLFWDVRKYLLRPDQIARESTKSFVLALDGLSFTGVIAIAVVDSVNQVNFRIPVFYLLISFLCYLIAFNIQDYKFSVARDVWSNILIDIATLSLVCTAVTVVFLAGYGVVFQSVVLIVALTGWLADHIVRIRYTLKDFRKYREREKRKNEQLRAAQSGMGIPAVEPETAAPGVESGGTG